MREEKNTDVVKIEYLPEYMKMAMEKKALRLGITLEEAYRCAIRSFCEKS